MRVHNTDFYFFWVKQIVNNKINLTIYIYYIYYLNLGVHFNKWDVGVIFFNFARLKREKKKRQSRVGVYYDSLSSFRSGFANHLGIRSSFFAELQTIFHAIQFFFLRKKTIVHFFFGLRVTRITLRLRHKKLLLI